MPVLDPDPDPDPAFSPPPSISTSLLYCYTRGRHQPSPRPAPPPPQPQPPLAPRLKHATLHPVAPLVTETAAAYFPEGLARFLIHGGQTHYVARSGAIGEGEGEGDGDGDEDGDGEGTVYYDAEETLDRDEDDGGCVGWIREDAGEVWGGEDPHSNPHGWEASTAAVIDECEETIYSPSLADDHHHRRRHHFPRLIEGQCHGWIGEDTGEEAWGRSDPHTPRSLATTAAAAAATDGEEEWAETTIYSPFHSPSLADDDGDYDHHRHHDFPRFDIRRSHVVVPRLFETAASDGDYETETGVSDGLYAERGSPCSSM
ncbi:hypothetical protein UCDDS831_g09256 [Diplodia seriata]|uniref:Uncharacterized protein n=1 Tax=Diplodia seriata TaxID=420778 RepID=A0A0G2FMI7_9PEZI|nr:hypothetical protein UCDDS831_g09256 [Diplodia seriata]